MTVAWSWERETAPLTASPTAVMVRVAPSGSESLAMRVEAEMSRVPPSATVAVSSVATGGWSVCSSTVRVKLAELSPWLLVTVTSISYSASSRGVPSKVRLLKEIQSGRGLPVPSKAAA